MGTPENEIATATVAFSIPRIPTLLLLQFLLDVDRHHAYGLHGGAQHYACGIVVRTPCFQNSRSFSGGAIVYSVVSLAQSSVSSWPHP